jgi:transposase-like protein
MTTQRRQHSGAFKAKVAREAIRGERTINEIAADYGVHPVQITQWKRVALDALPDIFASRRGTKHKEEETLKAALYQQIGQLKVELDWLKKKVGLVRRAEAPVGGTGASTRESAASVCLAGSGALKSIPRAERRACRKCTSHAVAGCTVHGDAVLWESPDDCLATQPGL